MLDVLHEDESRQLLVVHPLVVHLFLNSKEMHPFAAMATHSAAHSDNVLP